MNDLEFVNSNDYTTRAMRCQSDLPESEVSQYTNGCHVGDGDSPVACGWPDPDHISFDNRYITRGWSGTRRVEGSRRVHYLWRRWETPEEGYINCHMADDINPVLGLYVLYPSE